MHLPEPIKPVKPKTKKMKIASAEAREFKMLGHGKYDCHCQAENEPKKVQLFRIQEGTSCEEKCVSKKMSVVKPPMMHLPEPIKPVKPKTKKMKIASAEAREFKMLG